MQRNVKIGDVANKWDKEGKGVIKPNEFRTHMKTLGFKADPSEIDDIFHQIDSDGGGAHIACKPMTANSPPSPICSSDRAPSHCSR